MKILQKLGKESGTIRNEKKRIVDIKKQKNDKKTVKNVNTPPPPPLHTLLQKNRKIIFLSKKTETVGNIPKCDETHRWRQKPEKNCQKRKHTPSIYTLHAKNRKI